MEPEYPVSGVVLGSYNLPRLIELQIRLIRKHNGSATPILIVDDCSPGTGITPDPDSVFGDLCEIMRTHEDVTLWSNPERYGHAGGDLTCYFVGLQWAKMRKMKVLCKLSQRMLIDIPNWLHEGAYQLLQSGKPTGCNPCKEDHHHFNLRTEAILFQVESWYRQDVLDHLRPRPVTGNAAEAIVWHDMEDRVGTDMWRWPIMGHDRRASYPGIVWHCSHGIKDYQKLFKEHGVTMDANFTVQNWQHLPGYQW